MKKRLLAILLTALMVVGMVPLQAAAAGPQDQTALPSDGGELTSGSRSEEHTSELQSRI